MWYFKKFRNPKKDEQSRKKEEWFVTEEDVLLWDEVKILRHSCVMMKNEGIRRRRFNLIRDWFTIELGLLTGLRVMEMANLTISDLGIYRDYSWVKVRHGKGGKSRIVFTGKKFIKICQEYLKLREQFGFTNNPDDFLLISSVGKPLTTRCLEKAFKKCLKRAGINPCRYHIHNLRHTYGTYLYDLTRNIRLVQEQLGHSSVKTTETYTKVWKYSAHNAADRLYTQATKEVHRQEFYEFFREQTAKT